MSWKDAIGKTLLVFGAPPLILAFFGMLVLLLDTRGAGFWEVGTMVGFIPFFVWGYPLVGAGFILLLSAYLDERDALKSRQ